MRKTLTSAAIALALGAGAAQAAPITLPGAEPIFITFNNLEQIGPFNNIVVPGGGINVDGIAGNDTPDFEGNWGVFNITSLQLGSVAIPNRLIGGGTTFFSNDGTEGQLSGIFYGLTITQDGTGKKATGGYLDLYWDDQTFITNDDLAGLTYTPADRTAANKAGKFTDGTFLVRLKFMPGIISGDASTTLQSNVDVSIPQSDLENPGQANFFADVLDVDGDGVIGGPGDGEWAGALNGDWFFVDVDGNGVRGEIGKNERRDMRFRTNFLQLDQWSQAGVLGAISTDPAQAFTVAEPGIVGLLGLGLLGAGANLRRRKRV